MKVISLGLGVQSTALYLLSVSGMLEKADCAIFSDLGAEREATYQNLRLLLAQNFPIPIIVTFNDLYFALVQQRNSTGQRLASIPAFSESGGMLRRQCTHEYKIKPIQREIRKLHGLRPHQRMKPTEIWLGISTDEADRMKPSRDFNIVNRFPLLELGMSRSDCARIVEKQGLNPVKSSCVFCPYQSDHQWKALRDQPEDWQKALDVDTAIRDMSRRGMKDRMYLHRSKIPLERVDFEKQGELFTEECSGYCFL